VSRPKIGTRVRPTVDWNMLDSDVLRWQVDESPSEEFVHALFEMREIIEPAAAARAAERATDDEIRALRMAMAGIEGEPRGSGTQIDADIDFHMIILEASRNPMLRSLGAMIRSTLEITFSLGWRTVMAHDAVVQHRDDPTRRSAIAIPRRAFLSHAPPPPQRQGRRLRLRSGSTGAARAETEAGMLATPFEPPLAAASPCAVTVMEHEAKARLSHREGSEHATDAGQDGRPDRPPGRRHRRPGRRSRPISSPGFATVYDLAMRRDRARSGIGDRAARSRRPSAARRRSRAALLASDRVLAPIDHPTRPIVLITGTGLTHLGSARRATRCTRRSPTTARRR
jgi:hypothetical protein